MSRVTDAKLLRVSKALLSLAACEDWDDIFFAEQAFREGQTDDPAEQLVIAGEPIYSAWDLSNIAQLCSRLLSPMPGEYDYRTAEVK